MRVSINGEKHGNVQSITKEKFPWVVLELSSFRWLEKLLWVASLESERVWEK